MNQEFETKQCSNPLCQQIKAINEFGNDKSQKDGHAIYCKTCKSQRSKRDYIKNPERTKQNTQRRLLNNPNYFKEWHLKHPNYDKLRCRRKRLIDPTFRLKENLRRRINKALERNSKSGHTLNLLGCTIFQLRRHLESQFKEGMTWQNYGLHGWHIDHIIPCDSFDLSDLEQQKKCFHYTNLQPLWAKENWIKGNKMLNTLYEFIPPTL